MSHQNLLRMTCIRYVVTNCVLVQLQWLVRHQLPKNKSELEDSLLKKSIITPDFGFSFQVRVFYVVLFLFGLHGATSLFKFEVLDIAEVDLSFFCSNLSLYSSIFHPAGKQEPGPCQHAVKRKKFYLFSLFFWDRGPV